MDTLQMVLVPATQTEILQTLMAKLKANYIFPDVAEQICTCLQKHLEDGDYANISEGEFFALALTLHMQEVNHDEHLWVRWHAEPLPDDDGQLRLNPEWQDERRLESRLNNYGFVKVERLPGNIGCLEIHSFHRPEWGSETASAAMNFLADTSAMIIDLRQCTGGYPGMVALILSYLFGKEPIHLISIYWRDDDKTQEFRTLPEIPGKRYGEKPVYVLTSRVTFSAGEQFADILQSRKRAVLLGEKTDGGGHPGTSYRIHPYFEAFLPIGLVTNPVTGTDLEGVGVTPDISIPAEQAFTAAYRMALQTVLESLGESTSEPLQTLAKEIQTTLHSLEANQKI